MGGKDKRKDPDVDGGYAWVVLVGCFLMYMFVVRSVKSYGILYTEMLSYFEGGSGNTAWVGSVCMLLMFGLGPVSNLLSKTFSFRRVTFVGGLFLGTGYVLCMFVPSYMWLYGTFGLCVGFGYGLAFAPCSTIISFYFEKHRALANGITVSASGIGSLTFPFLYRFLIQTFGLRGTFLILGGMVSNVCVAACFFRQPKLLVEEKIRKRESDNKNGDQKALLNGDSSHVKEMTKANKKSCVWARDLLKLSLFKNFKFTLYVISFVLCMNGYGNNLILIPSHVKALGYDDVKVAMSVSIMGGCEVVARIGCGWFADKGLLSRRNIFVMNMFIAAIFALVAPLFKSFIFMAVYSAIIGIFPGSFWSLISVLLIEVVGMRDFTAAFGLISLCLAFGSLISQPTIGWLQDYYGNWNVSFIVTGCLLMASALLMAMEPLFERLCGLNKPEPDVEQEVIDQMPLRIRNKSSPPLADDTGSLLEEEVDVSFTSDRISRIYRPYQQDTPSKSPDRSSAPVVHPSDV